MAWNQLRPQWRQVTHDDMQVGTADTTSDDTQEYMTRLKLGTRNIFNAKMSTVRIGYTVVERCSH